MYRKYLTIGELEQKMSPLKHSGCSVMNTKVYRKIIKLLIKCPALLYLMLIIAMPISILLLVFSATTIIVFPMALIFGWL